jgi:hypothetical protein
MDAAAEPASSSASWLVCTAAGSVLELSLIRPADYAVLAAVEAALARSELARPLSGARHNSFRWAARGSAHGNQALARQLEGGSCRHPSARTGEPPAMCSSYGTAQDCNMFPCFQ